MYFNLGGLLKSCIEDLCEVSVTRQGDFLKFLPTKFLTKVSQIISNFQGYFEKAHSYIKTASATSWVTFGNIWDTFYSNIWSHCMKSKKISLVVYVQTVASGNKDWGPVSNLKVLIGSDSEPFRRVDKLVPGDRVQRFPGLADEQSKK